MTRSAVQSCSTAHHATLAQLVEHVFRKDGVPSSILGGGSRLLPYECSREEAHHKRHSAHKQHPKARFQYWPFGEFGCAHAQEKQSRQGNYYRKREGDF